MILLKRITIVCTMLAILSVSCPFALAAGDAGSIIETYAASLPPVRFRCGSGPKLPETDAEREERLNYERNMRDTENRLRACGPSGLPVIVQGLEHKDHRVVQLCTRTLVDTGAAAMPPLVAKLQASVKDPHGAFEQTAAGIIGTFDPRTRLEALALLLPTRGKSRSMCWYTVYHVARATKAWNNQEDPQGDLLASYALWFAQGLSEPDAQESAAFLLKRCASRIKSPEVSSKVAVALSAVLNAPTSRDQLLAKRACADALGSLPNVPANAISTLNRSTKSSDRETAEQSARSLVSLAQQNKDVSIDGVLNMLKSGDQKERMTGLRQLEFLHGNRSLAIPALLKLGSNPIAQQPKDLLILARVFEEYGKESLPAVPLLTSMLANRDQKVQQQACEALCAIGPGAATAVPALMRLRNATPDKWVQREATRAINKISDQNLSFRE
jgi:HEAT repeat protein